MRERGKDGKLIGTVQTTTGMQLSPLRCAVQRQSHRVTWSVGNGTMKTRSRVHAVRVVEPIKSREQAFYWHGRKRKTRPPYIVKREV